MVKETSANKLIRDNWIGQTERYEIAAGAAQKFQKELETVGKSVEEPLKNRMIEIHDNDKLIAQQRSKLQKQTGNLQKTTKQLEQLANSALNKVKEAGDVQNWAEMLDQDIRVLEQTVKLKNEHTGA